MKIKSRENIIFQKYLLTIFLFNCILLTTYHAILAQEDKGKIIVLHEKVGKEIDREENKKYKLFSRKSSFKSAVIYQLPESSYLIKIISEDLRTGEERIKWISRNKQEIEYYRNKIAHNANLPFIPQVLIILRDNSHLKGKIIEEDDQRVTVITDDKMVIHIQKSRIASIQPPHKEMKKILYYRKGLNCSRLLIFPSVRPLRKKEGYISNRSALFNGVNYGITNHMSIAAEVAFIPGVAPVRYLSSITPKAGINVTDKLAVSVGTVLAYPGIKPEEEFIGIPFVGVSYGRQDKNLTAGIARYFYRVKYNVYERHYIIRNGIKEYYDCVRLAAKQDFWNRADYTLLMLGGNIHLSPNVVLISENWFFISEYIEWGKQPFGLALRLFGERTTTEIGLIIFGNIMKENGFPIPWISIAYNFGR